LTIDNWEGYCRIFNVIAIVFGDFSAALIVGIQSGIGLSPSLPSTAFVPNQSPVLGQPQLEAERIVSVK